MADKAWRRRLRHILAVCGRVEAMARLVAVVFLVAALAALWSANADTAVDSVAERFPSRPLRIVVTFPPGGGTDLLARKLGDRLAERIGQTVIVENRPGASGNIGARVVADSDPDGYTLLMVNSTFAINPAVFATLPFSPSDDFSAVINVAFVPSVLIVPMASPVRNLRDWLAEVSGDQADLPQEYGSCGNGTPQHMAGEMLADASGRKLQQIPYKGCGPAVAAVAGNQVGAAIVTASSAEPMIRAGMVRALAITSAERSPLLPDVPTVAEQGWPDYELDQWHGLLAPTGTPASRIAFLNGELGAIVVEPDMQTSLRDLGFNPVPSTASEFQALIDADLVRFADLAERMHLRVD